MFIWEAFFMGLGSVLSFGWPKRGRYPLTSTERMIEGDWKAVSWNLNVAISKYKVDDGNVES